MIAKITLLLTFIGLISCFNIQTVEAETKNKIENTPSKIDSATLYLNASQINRSAEVTLKKGVNEVYINNVTNSILDNSLQIQLPLKVKIISVLVKKRAFHINDYPPIKQLFDSINKVKDEIELLENKIYVLKKETSVILNNKDVIAKENSTIQDLKDLTDFYSRRLSEIKKTEFDIKKEKQVKDAFLKKLKERHREALKKYRLANSQIQLVLEANENTKGKLNLQYLVSSAGWYPTYTFKIKDIDQEGELEYLSSVYNNTGNDWQDIKLNVSMVNPVQDLSQPKLSSWYLNYRRAYAKAKKQNAYQQSQRLNQSKQKLSIAENLEAEEGTEFDIVEESAYFESETKTFDEIEVGNSEITFDIPKTYTIPSDPKNYHTIYIQSVAIKTLYRHLVIPKVKDGAYFILSVLDWKKLGLIDASVNLYLRDTYLGESEIKTQTLKDNLDISLGKDNWVDVKRNKLVEKSSKKLLGSNVQETLSYKITVKNNYNNAINLEVQDQIPISQNSEIQISNYDLGGGQFNKLTGKITWKLKLPAKTQKTFTFSFGIKYPKNKPLIYKTNIQNNQLRAKFRR